MKYTVETEINKPVGQVVKLFKDRDSYKYWMEGLESIEPLEGVQGEEGARSLFRFKMGKRDMEMKETIQKVDFPGEYTVFYLAKGVENVVTSRFVKVTDSKTRYVNETSFKFSGMMKVISLLMSRSFKKQSREYLDDFKAFAENGKS